MATYKYAQFIVHNTSAAFDTAYHAGAVTPHSGIYRCEGCGREVISTQSHPLPPQNHHQHAPNQGTIRWRLIVYADHQPKA